MKVRNYLIAARALIDTPEKWRQDASIRDPQTCCAIVAINRVAGSFRAGRDSGAWRALFDALPEEWDAGHVNAPLAADRPGYWVGIYNDNWATHPDIMALFDRAITNTEPSGTSP